MSYWWLRLAEAFGNKAIELRNRGQYNKAEMMDLIAEVFKELAA